MESYHRLQDYGLVELMYSKYLCKAEALLPDLVWKGIHEL